MEFYLELKDSMVFRYSSYSMTSEWMARFMLHLLEPVHQWIRVRATRILLVVDLGVSITSLGNEIKGDGANSQRVHVKT